LAGTSYSLPASFVDFDVEFACGSVESCGVTLSSLVEETWATSFTTWEGHVRPDDPAWDYWDLLVDLQTVEEGRSDLVLKAAVVDAGDDLVFKYGMVFVP